MTVNEFFTNLASGATWAAGVAFQRSNPLPLDKYSVFQSEADLITYVTTNAVAYPGQIVAVYNAEAEAMAAYVISSVGENGTYIPVGTETVIDGVSVKENADGALEVAGFADADGLTLPQKQADGSIKWVAIDAIVKGDGNTKYEISLEGNTLHLKSDDGSDDSSVDLSKYLDNTDTTYTLSASGVDVTLTPSEGDAQTVSVDAYTKNEIDVKFEALPEDKDTTYSIAEGEKVLKLTGTVFSTNLRLEYNDTKIKLVSYEGEEAELVSEIDASAFVADGVLNNVEYDAENDKLIFTWNIVESVEGDVIKYKTIEVDVKDLVDTYTAGAKLVLNENEFSHATIPAPTKSAGEGREYITEIETDGYGHITGYKTATETVVDTNTTYELTDTTSSEAGDIQLTLTPSDGVAQVVNVKGYNKAKVDTLLGAKANSTDVYAKSETYSQTEIDELLEGIQAGSSESAASVKTQLDAYKKIVNTEIWNNEAGTGDSRIDTIESKVNNIEEGAQVNVIESVVVDNGTAEGTPEAKLTATLSGKIVTINDSAIQVLIATAQTKANEAATAASTAQAAADANAQNIQTNASDITNLKTLTGEHTTKIAALEQANTTHAAEFAALNETVTTHGTDIAGLKTGKADTTVTDGLAGRITANENAIKALNETIIPGINTEVAKKANADTVYTKTEIGTIAEGKTLVDMIADAQSEATYDDTTVKALIQGNTNAIAVLNGEDTGKSVRTIAGEEVAKVIDSAPEAYDTLKEIADWIANDKTGAAAMSAQITANTNAIVAINNETTGILATAKSYTDGVLVSYKVKDVDNITLQLNESGVASVKAISTDLLEQGSQELILSAGNSTGYNVNA